MAPTSMTHLSYWMLPPGELTSPVLTPKVTAHNDLTLTVVREEEGQRFSVMPELNQPASFSEHRQCKYVVLNFLKTKAMKSQLFQ